MTADDRVLLLEVKPMKQLKIYKTSFPEEK